MGFKFHGYWEVNQCLMKSTKKMNYFGNIETKVLYRNNLSQILPSHQSRKSAKYINVASSSNISCDPVDE